MALPTSTNEVRTGIAAIVLLIVPFLAACAANSAHYVCQFAPQDSTGTYAGTIFSQEIVIIHKKGSSLIYGGENGLEWSDYYYDKAEMPGFVNAGRLNNELHGRARFWFPTGKLLINLPPGTLLSYKCSEFEP